MNVKTLLLSVLLIASADTLVAQTQQQRLEKHLYYMAADSLRGRKAGSADARKVADYIEKEYRDMGMKPLLSTYRLYFTAQMSEGVTLVAPGEVSNQSSTVYRDVVAVIEGNDPVLKNEYIVVGGHYDHLGVKNGVVYNGADDNASGASTVIEVARQLMAHRDQLSRSVIIAAFDAEEIGLYGSEALAKKIKAAGMMGKVKMMMSIDMVGWLRQSGSLQFEGTGTLEGCADMLAEVAASTGVNVKMKKFESSIFTATDTEPFAKRGVSTLAVTTGLKSPYHKPEDDANLIDYPGLSKVADCITTLTLKMASKSESMTSTGKLASKHSDKVKPFEVGMIVGLDRSSAVLPQTIYSIESRLGITAGVCSNINFNKNFGIGVDVLYNWSNSYYPNAEDPLKGEPDSYHQHSVMVPVQMKCMFLGASEMKLGVGFGGYYGYRFNGYLDNESGVVPTSPHQYGIAWSIEDRLANLSLDFTFFYQLNTAIEPTAGSLVPNARRNGFNFTLGWYF